MLLIRLYQDVQWCTDGAGLAVEPAPVTTVRTGQINQDHVADMLRLVRVAGVTVWDEAGWLGATCVAMCLHMQSYITLCVVQYQ